MPRATRSRASRRRALALVLGVACLVVPTALVSQAGPADAALSCGGEVVYKAPNVPWTCTFDDEFSGTTLDRTKWTVQLTAVGGYTTGTWGTRVCYIDSPNDLGVLNGYLYLAVRKETSAVKCGAFSSVYTGGTISTHGKFSQTYGRYEIRAKFPAATIRGLHAALWMWPVNDTKYGAEPKSGEIDIAEHYSSLPTVAVPYIHYAARVKDTHAYNWNCAITPGAFTTYTLVWTSTTMTIAFNGKVCVQDTWDPAYPLKAPQPFDSPFFTVLTQGLGDGTNSLISSTPLPASTIVDYVRIWK